MQILQLENVKPWYVDICNFLVASMFLQGASMFLQGASRAYKEKLKVMLNITYGMIRIFGDSTVTKSFAGAFRILRSSPSSISVIQHPEVVIMDQVGQPKEYSTVGSIGLPFSKMLTNLCRPANNVSKQEWLSAKGMKCPNSRFYFVKFFMCGVLISWDHSLSPMETFIFSLSLTMCRDGGRLRPPRLMMLNVSRALISNQGSHFCNRTMSTLLEKYRVVHWLPLLIIHRSTAKLRCSIGKSRNSCKRWQILARTIGADS
ncbi:hypothetical protein CR513_23103, partial [Mucuna pruriens]